MPNHEYLAIPLQVVELPNFFQPLMDDRWIITSPNAQELYFQLSIQDGLGTRRFIPAAGATINVIFQRMDEFQSTPTRFSQLESQTQTVTKPAVPNADDRSLWKISLNSDDVQKVRSGTVLFELSQSGTTTKFVQNYFLKRKLTNPGF